MPSASLIKGSDAKLVIDGQIDWKAMKRHLVSKHDLEEDLRLGAETKDISRIRTARLERSGDVSFRQERTVDRALAPGHFTINVRTCNRTTNFSLRGRSKFPREQWPRFRDR